MSEYIVHTFLRIAIESEPKSYGRLRTIGPKFLLPNTAFGRTLWLQDWAVETGIAADTIRYRIKQGWNPEWALTKIPKARKKIASGECG